MEKIIRIARLSELKETVPTSVQVHGVDLTVLKLNGAIIVMQGFCPHERTSLAEGSVDHGELICSGHGWRFDCLSGKKVDDPNIRLKLFQADVEEDHIGVSEREINNWMQTLREQNDEATYTTRSLKELPGPRGLPLIGNMHQLDMTKLHLILEDWARTYGALYRFRLGATPLVVVAEPTLIHKVFRQRPEVYRRWSIFAPIFAEMGMKGVFSAEGEQWHRQRRVAMHALKTSHLRQFFPTLTKMTARLKAHWEAAACAGHTVDLQSDLMRFTVDVTTELAFGYDLNTLEEAGDQLQQHLELLMPMLNRRIYAPFPYWRYIKLRADRALDKALAQLHQFIAELISQCRTRILNNPQIETSPSNFLEALLTARSDDGITFTEEEISGNILTMLLAGEDTTANAMTWMAHFMSEHPETQECMQREADLVLGTAPMLQHFSDHERLTYIDAMIQETLRLKSIAPLFFMEANHATDLGGVHLPAGTVVCLLTRFAGLQENSFSAAEQFRPERWLVPLQTPPNSHSPSAMMPFGSGPRFCPGRSLALLEIKSVMAMLCRNFSISKAADAKNVGERLAFAMMPTNVMIKFSKRK